MNNPPKICFLMPGKYPVPATRGGTAEKFTELMAGTMGEAAAVHIISPYETEAEKKSGEYKNAVFHYISCPSFAVKLYKVVKKLCRIFFKHTPVSIDPYFRRALKIIRNEKYDWVISENAINFIKPLKKHSSSRVAFHLHNTCRQLTPFEPGPLMKEADIIIAVSDYVAGKVKKAGYKGKIVTLKNVTDVSLFKEGGEKRAEMREKFGFEPDDFVVVFSGRLIREKGILKLMNAIELIADEKIKLLAVGGTAFRDLVRNEFARKLQKKAEASGKRIVFAGFAEYNKLPLYYHCADTAVFPSLTEEAAGTAVTEAMSAGLPVVVSDAGGLSEYAGTEAAIVVKRDDNFTMNLAHAISELKNNAGKRDKMSRAAVELADSFSRAGYGKRIIEILDSNAPFTAEKKPD